MNIGIIGSKGFSSHDIIKQLLYKLKTEFGEDLVICSGGTPTGTEFLVKKYALQFNLGYKEFNPANTKQNLYSFEPENYYEKKYHVSHGIHRYKRLIIHCNIIFIVKEKGVQDSQLLDAALYCKKINKKLIVYSN